MKDTILIITGMLLLAAVAMSPVACTMHGSRLVADAIASGADPIEAKCAIEGGGDRSAMCIASAASKR